MNNTKKWLVPVIIVFVLLVIIIVLVIPRPKENVVLAPTISTPPISSTTQPVPPSSTSQVTPTIPSAEPSKPTTTLSGKTVSCTSGECFFPYFVKCSPVELKMPFGEGAIYQIIVYGIENGKCHYTVKTVDASGKVIPFGPPSTECFMPVDKITTATVEHLFGVDAAAGKETVKAEQDQLFTDYCSQK